jgi:hypothetical protein
MPATTFAVRPVGCLASDVATGAAPVLLTHMYAGAGRVGCSAAFLQACRQGLRGQAAMQRYRLTSAAYDFGCGT